MKKQILSILLCLSIGAVLLPAIPMSVWAADSVTYIDAVGNQQSASATLVTSGLTTWKSGWYYVSGEVSISSVTVNGDVHLILTDNSNLAVLGSAFTAGIRVEGSNSLTIYGQAGSSGTLKAGSGGFNAGIGGGSDGASNGKITINGGTVTASGGYGAAIGGSSEGGNGGTITINGGTVTATGTYGAAIGGGSDGGSGGTIIINGGTVTATGWSGAAIGGGSRGGSGGTITINGGTVMASGTYGAGIGGASGSGGSGGGSGGTITINGGTVTATGSFGAGIGGGNDGGRGGTVTISGGSVKASSGFSGQAIGHGNQGTDSGTLKDGSGSDVFLTTVTLSNIPSKTAVTSLTTNGTTYGTKDMKTDESGKLYLWLPSGTTVTGAIATSGSFNGWVPCPGTGTMYMDYGLKGMTLSSSTVPENVPVGTAVGSLTTTISGDTSSVFTYLLVPGEGDGDNGSFSISGDTLQLAFSPDYETKSDYNIRIRTTNRDGLYFEKPFMVKILDVNEVPAISTSAGNTAAVAGQTVAADSFVTVSDVDSATLAAATVSIADNFQSGHDRLSFSNKDSDAYGNITGTYDTSTGVLTFTSADATATLAQWQAALRTVEFSYESGDGTPVTLERTIEFKVNDGELDSAKSAKAIAFAPLVLSATPGNGAEAVSASGNVAITFSEAMSTLEGTVSLTLEEGDTLLLTGGTWSNSNTTYTTAYSGLAYDSVYTLAVSGFQDAAGNVMPAYSHGITTELEPLTPSVSPDTLTIGKGRTAGITAALGQGTAAATTASITIEDHTIASIDSSLLTGNGTVTVSGLAVGTTDIIITFNDSSNTERTISVKVVPTPPIWPVDSSLTATNVTQTGTTLTWTAANDTTAVTKYQIYQDGTLVETVDGALLTYSVTGLTESTAYSFQVKAGNDDGMWTTGGPTVNVTTSAYSSSSDAPPITAKILGDGIQKIVNVTTSGDSAFAAISKEQSKILANNGSLTLSMPTIKNTVSYGVKLPSSSLSKDAGGTLTMNTNLGSITVPSNMLSSLAEAPDETAQITIRQGNSASLPSDVQNEIGNRPILHISISLNGIEAEWRNPAAPVTVSIPYTPTAEEVEHPESIIVWYIDGKGSAVCVPSGQYDAVTGSVVFSTTHFSQYAVGHQYVRFSDVANSEWYSESVSYLSSRSVISGTGNGEFSPAATITRAEFVTMLARLSGDDLNCGTASSFSDVSAGDWFVQAVQWANHFSISAGSDGKFNPNEEITREQVAVMLYRYAKYKGYDVSINEDTNLLSYKDSLSISDYAYSALQWACGVRIIQGDNVGNLSPNGCATRAQAAVILQRFLENVADKK